MMKILKNAAIWFAIAIAVTILTHIILAELDDIEYSRLIFITVAFYAVCFALTGTVVQGAFIKADYFKIGAAASIFVVGALILIVVLLIFLDQSAPWNIDRNDLWNLVMLLSVPSYAVTAISYFATRKG